MQCCKGYVREERRSQQVGAKLQLLAREDGGRNPTVLCKAGMIAV